MEMRMLMAAAAALVLLSGCGGRQEKEMRDGKLDYSPEINEVSVMKLEKTDFPMQLVSNGRVSAAAKASLTFGTTGTISRINVRNGQRVPAGTVIAELDRPDLRLALDAASASLEKARLDLYDVLAGQGYAARDTISVPDDVLSMAKIRSGYNAAVNAMRKAEYDLSGTVLRAPFTGCVADLGVKRYDQTPNGPFCSLVDDSSMDVDFPVMEAEYAFLEKGLGVKVMPFADMNRTYAGTLTDINPVVDKNGQVALRAKVSGGQGLVDGMNVKVTVEKNLPGRMVVPRSAVVVRDNLDVLFTYTDDGKAHWIYVNILASNRESFVVEANSDRGAVLKEGDIVIISNNLNLADGSSVRLK